MKTNSALCLTRQTIGCLHARVEKSFEGGTTMGKSSTLYWICGNYETHLGWWACVHWTPRTPSLYATIHISPDYCIKKDNNCIQKSKFVEMQLQFSIWRKRKWLQSGHWQAGLWMRVYVGIHLLESCVVTLEAYTYSQLNGIYLSNYVYAPAVAYLGFQEGGSNVCWPQVLTQKEGGQIKFSNFFTMSKKIVWPKGGHGQFGQGGQYATVHLLLYDYIQACHAWECTNSICQPTSGSTRGLPTAETKVLQNQPHVNWEFIFRHRYDINPWSLYLEIHYQLVSRHYDTKLLDLEIQGHIFFVQGHR